MGMRGFSQSDNVTYHGDPKIAELMDAYKNYNRKNDLADGFRVQISFGNDRQEVYNNKARLYKDFPNEHCYVLYEQPYYKLRLGDFATRLEAYEKLQAVITKYPGAFIVKDKIKVK
jgi:hypothetical protein